MTLLTPAQLRAIMPSAPADIWAPAMAEAMEEWGILSVPARAAFLAVCGEETREFHGHRERLNYDPAGLARVWPKDFRGPDGAPNAKAVMLGTIQPMATREKAIAEDRYGGKLGNIEAGDGWDFRGGCPIQLTGRATWDACARAHGLDLSRDELAGWADDASADPMQAASCSAWFWTTFKPKIMPLVETGEQGDFLAACRHVGYPPPGVQDIWLRLWRKGREVLGG